MTDTYNIMTLAMERLTRMLLSADRVLERMGETPYGVRKATRKEQLQMAENLTPEQMFSLIEKHGAPKVNRWLHSLNKEI